MSARSALFARVTRVTLLSLGIAAVCYAQEPAGPITGAIDSQFEELPELKASEMLKPEVLKGPYHTVRDPVLTYSGINQFVIDSDFGVFQADGNEMLLRRVGEVYAIERLDGVSKTDQFKGALIAAAKSPVNAAKNIVKDPARAISNVPKGVMKFMNRAGDAVKNIGKKGNDSEGGKAEQMIGYTNAKRKIAIDMGIDPYSSNPVLQKKLGDVAWASWAGGFAFSAATFPISGPAGAALTVTKMSSGLDNLLQEKSPAELQNINRAALRAMGANDKDIEGLLGNRAFSPSNLTEFVLDLRSLEGVANRAAFVRVAASDTSAEADAVFCVQTAALMSQIHKSTKPLARLSLIGDLPLCIARDGTIILALQWDYAAWTPGAASVVEEIEKMAHASAQKSPVMVVLSGQMSPRLRQELERRGITAQDRVGPGPLK